MQEVRPGRLRVAEKGGWIRREQGELAVVPGSHNANYAAADHLAELFLAFLHSRVLV